MELKLHNTFFDTRNKIQTTSTRERCCRCPWSYDLDILGDMVCCQVPQNYWFSSNILSITISVMLLIRDLILLLLPAPTPKAELSPLPGTSDIIIPSTQVKISEVDTTRYIHIRQGQSSTRVFRETSVWHKPRAILFSTISVLSRGSPVAAVAVTVTVVAADVAVCADVICL